MKTVALAVFVGALAASFVPGTPAKAEDVVLYSQRDYRGESRKITGDWNGRSSFQGRTRSMRVPDGYVVTVYSDQDYRGESRRVTRDWNLSSSDRWNGRINSLRIDRYGDVSDRPIVVIGNRLVVYSEPGFRGRALTLKGDWRGDSSWDGSPYSVRSLRVPSGYTAIGYSERDYRGSKVNIRDDWDSRDGSFRIRSVRLVRDVDVDDGYRSAPVLYAGRNYQGVRRTLTKNWPGDGFWDGSPNAVKSMRVPRGWRVVAYEDRNYRGRSTVITGDWNPSPSSWWSGRIRSVRVERGAVLGRDDAPEWDRNGDGKPDVVVPKLPPGLLKKTK